MSTLEENLITPEITLLPSYYRTRSNLAKLLTEMGFSHEAIETLFSFYGEDIRPEVAIGLLLKTS